jgi:ElaB/YqjD/DUF883 family membrane-anchored ribosome-binding protein
MSNPAETMRDTMRDNIKEVRKAAQDSVKAASKTTDDLQADLEALRDDVMQLVEKLGSIASTRGSRAWKRTKSGVGEAMSDAEALARKTGDDLTEVIEDSIHTRPYTTLAVVAGIGFLVGASWRR